MKILETQRLILRTWTKADVAPMAKINMDQQVMEHFPGLINLEQTKALIQKINNHYDKYGYTLYAVELKSSGEFIGFVGLFKPSFDAHFTPATEIGWRLSSQHWRQGYATEAATAVLEYAFKVHKLDEVVSFTVVNNLASRRVMEKIGLKYNPKDDFNHPNIKDPQLVHHVLYRLKRSEHESQ